jgi:hypothetical protein
MEWLIKNKEWLFSGIAISVPLALLGIFFSGRKNKQIQKGDKNSGNIQVGGNLKITENQKGGNNSTNIQTQQMVLHVGIDEKRAREIYHEMNLQVRKDYTEDALFTANTRIAEFENRLMPKMAQVEGALEAFADPGFQLLLIEAQKTAASTERPADYDLLSELLVHRFQNGQNRNVRAGISFAVEIIDKVSDDALLALTVSHAISIFTPVTGDIYQGLDVLDELFGKLLYNELPIGHDWLDHLDILNAIRQNSFGQLKKIQQYYSEILCGYVDIGMAKESESHDKAIEILLNNNIASSILCEHTLNKKYIRLNIPNISSIDGLFVTHTVINEGKKLHVPVKLTDEQKDALRSIYNLYLKDENIKNENVGLFMGEWNKRPNLKTLREWWDNIPNSFSITSVGKVLAHSNAQRCDKSLPPLN